MKFKGMLLFFVSCITTTRSARVTGNPRAPAGAAPDATLGLLSWMIPASALMF